MTDLETSLRTYEDARRLVRDGMEPERAAAALVETLTEAERLWCLDGDVPAHAGLAFLYDDGYHQAAFPAARLDRIGAPGIAFADGPRGAVIGNATCFPVPMARGATWDPALEERVGEAIGRELRALGADLTGAVCINLLRHPAWGRAQETYGEDPHHVGEMGAALTRGLQRHVMACVKHFAVNSMENARFTVDIEVDDVALHEVFLPHFRRVVDEGVASVMTSYNSMNGEWCGQNAELLDGVLRGEWDFQGFVISDWIFGLRDAALSLSAGLDIEMPWRMVRMRDLPQALADGSASWADVDAAVTRILATTLRFDAMLSAPAPELSAVGSTEHRSLAREVAARSTVLLKNDPVDGTPVLPLAPESRLAVVGRLADRVNVGDGGSSDVWDLECRTILDGIRSAFTDVRYDDGTDLASAASAAASADAVVLVVGTTYEDEGEFIGDTPPELVNLFPPADEPEVVEAYEKALALLPTATKPEHVGGRPTGFSRGGDRVHLRLRDSDRELVRAVAAANPRTVVVLQTGSAIVVQDWISDVPALVQAWYAGAEAGPGLADVLTGLVEPGGRLPFSVPTDESHLPAFDKDATSFTYDRWHGWWHLAEQGVEPAFPFGFGLGYTSFAVEDVHVEMADGRIVARGVVRNLGDRDGSDVVQVYADLPDADAPGRLLGFARVEVAAGAATSFVITAPLDRLARRNSAARSWTPATGTHVVRVGRSAADPAAVRFPLEV